MPFTSEVITAIALGIALSASAGFRVFIPLLGVSIAALSGWVHLPDTMNWMGTWTALICFGTAALVEMTAYYIPFVDNLLDTISTPLAIGAGTVLAYSLFPMNESPGMVKWVTALIAGGGSAGIIQAGTGLIRLFSTKATAGTANAAVATGENAAAVTTVSLSFIIPVIVAILLILLICWILSKILRRLFSEKRKET